MATFSFNTTTLHATQSKLHSMFCALYLKIFSNEAHFDLGGYINKQYYRIWGTENPHAYIEKTMHPKRVTVWSVFLFRGIIASIFFKIKQEEAITVNGDRYLAMLNEFLYTKIEEKNIDNIWFQQDSVTCHTAEA